MKTALIIFCFVLFAYTANAACPNFDCSNQYSISYMEAYLACQNLQNIATTTFDKAALHTPGSPDFENYLSELTKLITKDHQITIKAANGTTILFGKGESGLRTVVTYYANLDEARLTLNVNPYFEVYTNSQGDIDYVDLYYTYETHAKLAIPFGPWPAGAEIHRQSYATYKCVRDNKEYLLDHLTIVGIRDYLIHN